MLNQTPITVDETTNTLLGPDTYGYTIYRELDVYALFAAGQNTLFSRLGASGKKCQQNTGFLTGDADLKNMIYGRVPAGRQGTGRDPDKWQWANVRPRAVQASVPGVRNFYVRISSQLFVDQA